MLKEVHIEKIRKNLSGGKAELPKVFDALSDQSRYRIVMLLLEHKDLCVTDISHIVGVSVPAASQHFKILEHAGVVQRTRKGQMTCYTIASGNPLVKSLTKLMIEKR